MKILRIVSLLTAALFTPASLRAADAPPDVVRLGNLKFAHYAAVAYMKELAPKYNLEIKEQMFTKGLDIVPAIISGDIDIAASALEAAIAGRAGGAKVFIVAKQSDGTLQGRAWRVGRNGLAPPF